MARATAPTLQLAQLGGLQHLRGLHFTRCLRVLDSKNGMNHFSSKAYTQLCTMYGCIYG